MDSDCLKDDSVQMSESNQPARADDFGFAFDNASFSDRVLRIEIIEDESGSKTNGDDPCTSVAEWVRNRKRRRGESTMEQDEDVGMQREEQTLASIMPDTDDVAAYENPDDEAVAMIEESSSCAGTTSCNLDTQGTSRAQESPSNMECSTPLRVKTINISSPILAAKSPFFYKLFSNGMIESDRRQVVLRITATEEVALMDLLNFMYSNTLSAANPAALLDVLMAADKFEVASCMRHCCRVLLSLPMTCETALLYLDLPSSVLMADAVQPLVDAAKQYLIAQYKDITKSQDEALKLPLTGIEVLLASDDLQVASEDAVYDFVLKWGRKHYPKVEVRREILSKRLARLIRFPLMSCRKLGKVMSCNDLDHDLASKIVLDALFYKAEPPYRQQLLMMSEEANSPNRRFVGRAYKYRLVKILEFENPGEHCIVYLDLKRSECAKLHPQGRIYSQAFNLGGQGFFLSAHCNMDQQNTFPCFGLFLGMQEKGAASFTVDYEFAARLKPSEDYISKYKGSYTFAGGKAVGYRNLFSVPWSTFISEESDMFIRNTLYLRAVLIVKQ